MSPIEEKIAALETQLQELRTLKEWQGVGGELVTEFSEREDVREGYRVRITIEDEQHEAIRDWTVPYAMIRDDFIKMGKNIDARAKQASKPAR